MSICLLVGESCFNKDTLKIYSEHVDSLRLSCTRSKPFGELSMTTIHIEGLGILFPGGKSFVSQVAIKTGTIEDAETVARALLEICDDEGNCCNTSQSGLGLDNPGTSDRVRGGTDVYSDQAILGTCSEVSTLNFVGSHEVFLLFADASAVTPSSNTMSYTLRGVPSSPGRSFLYVICSLIGALRWCTYNCKIDAH